MKDRRVTHSIKILKDMEVRSKLGEITVKKNMEKWSKIVESKLKGGSLKCMGILTSPFLGPLRKSCLWSPLSDYT